LRGSSLLWRERRGQGVPVAKTRPRGGPPPSPSDRLPFAQEVTQGPRIVASQPVRLGHARLPPLSHLTPSAAGTRPQCARRRRALAGPAPVAARRAGGPCHPLILIGFPAMRSPSAVTIMFRAATCGCSTASATVCPTAHATPASSSTPTQYSAG